MFSTIVALPHFWLSWSATMRASVSVVEPATPRPELYTSRRGGGPGAGRRRAHRGARYRGERQQNPKARHSRPRAHTRARIVHTHGGYAKTRDCIGKESISTQR